MDALVAPRVPVFPVAEAEPRGPGPSVRKARRLRNPPAVTMSAAIQFPGWHNTGNAERLCPIWGYRSIN